MDSRWDLSSSSGTALQNLKGLQRLLAEKRRVTIKEFALLALSGLTNEMARHWEVKKLQVTANNVGFC